MKLCHFFFKENGVYMSNIGKMYTKYTINYLRLIKNWLLYYNYNYSPYILTWYRYKVIKGSV